MGRTIAKTRKISDIKNLEEQLAKRKKELGRMEESPKKKMKTEKKVKIEKMEEQADSDDDFIFFSKEVNESLSEMKSTQNSTLPSSQETLSYNDSDC